MPLRLTIKLIVAFALLPILLTIVALGVLFAVVGLFFAVLVPLLPLAFVVFLVWAIVRATSRPTLYSS